MKRFTYFQYVKIIHALRLNAALQLAEESTPYQLERKQQEKVHDKMVKNILKDKKEMANFLNQFVMQNEEIKSEDLVCYTNSYITKKYKAKESDLVYRIKEQEIFFLVEHQSTIDGNMHFRMLNYCIDLMQEWNRGRRVGRNTNYPIIVPILIYTGNEKWNIQQNFKERQIDNCVFKNYKIDFQYNVVDISKIPDKALLEKRTMFGYGMLLEKAKNKQELKRNLEKIIMTSDKKEQLEEIANIVSYLLEGALEDSEQQELLEKIEEKVGDRSMSSLYERLVEENRQMIRKGRKQTAENMLKKNFDDKVILEITQITKKELEEVKRKVAIAK